MPRRVLLRAASVKRRSLIACAAGLVLLPSGWSWAAAPAETGIGIHDFEWRDDARDRKVPARLYWPASVPQGQAVPLVVFSHGLGGSRTGYSYLGRHWAGHGYASLHVQHSGSDWAVWSANLLDLVANLRTAASEANAIARAKDVSFGITALLAEPAFGSQIDPERIAVAGHSYGANTALLVAGATLQRKVDGRMRAVSFRDPRVKAAVLLSVPPFYGEKDMAAILRTISIPTLHVTGTDDVIRVPGYQSEVADRIAVFDAVPSGPGASAKVLAVFNGGTHSIFTDRPGQAAPELSRQVKAATGELSSNFLDAALRGATYAVLTAWFERQGALLANKVLQLAR